MSALFGLESAPPEAPLREAVRRAEAAGIVVALGGSGLLAALGLERAARDWDVTTDAAVDEVAAALAGVAVERHGPSGVHADHKLRLAGGAVEIICGFAIHSESGVAHIPTIVTSRVEGIPIGSPEAWAAAYALIGRAEKSERLLRWLDTNGADHNAIARLLAQPLPAALAASLRALPHARPGER